MDSTSANIAGLSRNERISERNRINRYINEFPTADELKCLIEAENDAVDRFTAEHEEWQRIHMAEAEKLPALKQARDSAELAHMKQVGLTELSKNKMGIAFDRKMKAIRAKKKYESELEGLKTTPKHQEIQMKIRKRKKELDEYELQYSEDEGD